MSESNLVPRIKDFDSIYRVRFTNGKGIGEADIKLIKQYCEENDVVMFSPPSTSNSFCLNYGFFCNNEKNLIYVKNGNVVKFGSLNPEKDSFIAFRIEMSRLFIYGYRCPND